MSAAPTQIPHGRVPHQYPPLPGRGLTGLPYIRKHFYVPEVIPIVAVVIGALSMGAYFSINGSKANDVQWQVRTQPWLKTPTDQTRWDGAGGVRETIQKELEAAKQKAKSLVE